MRATKAKRTTEFGRYVRGFLNDSCCGEPMDSGYDNVDGSGNAYYRDCNVCNVMEVRTTEALRADFDEEKARGTSF